MIPDKILQDLKDHTDGGFVLLYADGEDSVFLPATDSPVITAGLLLRAKVQYEALEERSKEMVKDSMQ